MQRFWGVVSVVAERELVVVLLPDAATGEPKSSTHKSMTRLSLANVEALISRTGFCGGLLTPSKAKYPLKPYSTY